MFRASNNGPSLPGSNHGGTPMPAAQLNNVTGYSNFALVSGSSSRATGLTVTWSRDVAPSNRDGFDDLTRARPSVPVLWGHAKFAPTCYNLSAAGLCYNTTSPAGVQSLVPHGAHFDSFQLNFWCTARDGSDCLVARPVDDYAPAARPTITSTISSYWGTP